LLRMDFNLLQFCFRVGIASVVMAAVCWIGFVPLQSVFDSGNTPLRMGILLAVLAMSSLAFLGVARLLKLNEVNYVVNAVLDLLTWPRPRNANSTGPS